MQDLHYEFCPYEALSGPRIARPPPRNEASFRNPEPAGKPWQAEKEEEEEEEEERRRKS